MRNSGNIITIGDLRCSSKRSSTPYERQCKIQLGAFVSKFPAELAFRWRGHAKRSLHVLWLKIWRFSFFFFQTRCYVSLDIRTSHFPNNFDYGRNSTSADPQLVTFSRNAFRLFPGMFRFQNAHQTKQRLLETKHRYRARGYSTLKAFF